MVTRTVTLTGTGQSVSTLAERFTDKCRKIIIQNNEAANLIYFGSTAMCGVPLPAQTYIELEVNDTDEVFLLGNTYSASIIIEE